MVETVTMGPALFQHCLNMEVEEEVGLEDSNPEEVPTFRPIKDNRYI